MEKMARITELLFFCFVLLAVVARPNVLGANTNILHNPSFEGDFSKWNDLNSVSIAPSWLPWWLEDSNRDPTWARPDWSVVDSSAEPNRVQDGSRAQRWSTLYQSHQAGVLQQVSGVTIGGEYEFTLAVQVWSSQEDDPNSTRDAANPYLSIGLDPTGAGFAGWAAPPPTIIWSEPLTPSELLNKWAWLRVVATAQSDKITVYVRSSPQYAVKHNAIFIDSARLILLSTPLPTPTPVTPTAIPTNTPWPTPTLTPLPTGVWPTATATVVSTPTIEVSTAASTTTPTSAELSPTAPPLPTETAIEMATATPLATPTETPMVTVLPTTATSEPTAIATSLPTVGSIPTPTPTPAVIAPNKQTTNRTIAIVGGVALVGTLGLLLGLSRLFR